MGVEDRLMQSDFLAHGGSREGGTIRVGRRRQAAEFYQASHRQ
jgi:hypothetical protein